MHHSRGSRLVGKVNDPPELLKLLLFVDADFAGETRHSKSTSGGYLVLAGPNTWFPLCWICKMQSHTSRSTTEAEVISLAASLFAEALPTMDLWDMILGRSIELIILEDNQATIKIVRKGYSSKLRHIYRTHKVNLGSIKEVLEEDNVTLMYCNTHFQAADIFTKALAPSAWQNALDLLGIVTDATAYAVEGRVENGQLTRGESRSSAPPGVKGAIGGAPVVPKRGSCLFGASHVQHPSNKKLDQSCSMCGDTPPAKGAYAACEAIDSVVAAMSEAFDPESAQSVLLAAAKTVGELKDTPVVKRSNRPSGKLKGWGQLLEVCTGENSNLGQCAAEYDKVNVIRVTKESDFSKSATVEKIMQHLRDNPGCSMHGSLPCTVWSAWQWMAVHRYGKQYQYKLDKRRQQSRKMIRSFAKCAALCVELGGEVSFEWPDNCSGWLQRDLIKMIHELQLQTVLVDGCACGMTDKEGTPVLKRWRFVTSSERVANSLRVLRCKHPSDFKHGEICGGLTKKTEEYPHKLCHTLLGSLFSFANHTPALPCKKAGETKSHNTAVHRIKELSLENFAMSPNLDPCGYSLEESCSSAPSGGATNHTPSAVTKLLERSEMMIDPKAVEAVGAEGQALVQCGTWLENTVIERDELLRWARESGVDIHCGDLMAICSIKFWERDAEFHKYKGRICFRGDSVKDQYGSAAVFQELSASPTTVQAANSNIAYGMLPGHKTTQSDAIRAYVQSLLKGKCQTWVHIPYMLWPKHWKNQKWRKPMCLLERALYGHPESGAHWQEHLEEAIRAIGGIPVPNHPSSFWFVEAKLLLTVYVDDLLLSGPAGKHEVFWRELIEKGIKLDPAEDLDRFLGRSHVSTDCCWKGA